MSRQQSVFQALAAAGAVLITFIGVCHEVIGARLFPWAPALFGVIGWHGMGIAGVVIGIGLLGGVLRLISFPVVSLAVAITVVGLGITLFTAVAHREFHFFALTASLAGTSVALFHRAGVRLAAASAEIGHSRA
jgi:hypothetical protein